MRLSYFWKWKTATVFAAFTWTLHKPAGSTVQSIISCVGGCEMRQEEGTGRKTKTTKYLWLVPVCCSRVTVPNFLTGDYSTSKVYIHSLQHVLTWLLYQPRQIMFGLTVFSSLLPPQRYKAYSATYLTEWSENTKIIRHLLGSQVKAPVRSCNSRADCFGSKTSFALGNGKGL